MSEPEIIRNDRPHEVTIPEGSNKALAKTAAQQEPSVRKVLREGGDEVEHIHPDKFVSDTPEPLASRPDKYVHADAADNTQVPDAYVKVTEARGPADTAMPPRAAQTLPAQAQALGAASESSQAKNPTDASEASAQPAQAMPEMDFPARVVHLRIENELLQKRLDELDKDT